MNEINEQLKKAKEEILLKNTLVKKLQNLEQEIKFKKDELKKLKIRLDKEYKDLHNLETMSFANLVATILGNKDEKIYKERKEYLKAKFNFDQIVKVIELTQDNIEELNKSIKELHNSDDKYDKLLEEKRRLLKMTGKSYDKQQLYQLEKELEDIIQESIEISEALEANKICLLNVEVTLESLDSAANWGTYDILGGGMMSSIIKHDKINDAKTELNKLTYSIERLSKELEDINLELPFNELNQAGSSYMFDIFFDNIFTDMSVQREINNSIEKLTRIEKQLVKLEKNLIDKQRDIISKMKCYKEKIEEKIEDVII